MSTITSHTRLTFLDIYLWLDGRGLEAEELATQLALSLLLVQSVVLNHEWSKFYLGRVLLRSVSYHFHAPSIRTQYNISLLDTTWSITCLATSFSSSRVAFAVENCLVITIAHIYCPWHALVYLGRIMCSHSSIWSLWNPSSRHNP